MAKKKESKKSTPETPEKVESQQVEEIKSETPVKAKKPKKETEKPTTESTTESGKEIPEAPKNEVLEEESVGTSDFSDVVIPESTIVEPTASIVESEGSKKYSIVYWDEDVKRNNNYTDNEVMPKPIKGWVTDIALLKTIEKTNTELDRKTKKWVVKLYGILK